MTRFSGVFGVGAKPFRALSHACTANAAIHRDAFYSSEWVPVNTYFLPASWRRGYRL